MLALSSLSRRSLNVGIAWLGLWIVGSMVATGLGDVQRATIYQRIAQEEGANAIGSWDPNGRPSGEPRMTSPHPNQTARWAQIQARVEKVEAETAPTNWRPLCSYTANLQRLGESLLNTDRAWVEIGRAIEKPRAAFRPFLGGGSEPAPINERRLADRLVPQYPWTWSAGVLAALLGLSLWILNVRVKSLDRLR
jgi:hypothetical protein